MRRRVLTWFVACLLVGVAIVLFWRKENSPEVASSNDLTKGGDRHSPAPVARPATTNVFTVPAATAANFLTTAKTNAVALPKTNFLAYRLSNTKKSSGKLLRNDHAIILENALIDTTRPLGFAIPQNLKLVGDPGSYIVQARGPTDDAFRAALVAAGADSVSYIPNNAWLVRASAAVANRLAADPLMQSVLPWEPVYKLKAELLELAMTQQPLPPEAALNLLVFTDAQAEVVAQLEKLKVTTLAQANSPFGKIITVRPGDNWTALAQLSGVQLMERAYPRASANDLSRVRIGVATNTVTTNTYMGLTGKSVLVGVNDTGVDAAHLDFTGGRVLGLNPQSLIDDNGHGTHVAGIIAGDGAQSITVTNARGSINPGTNGQYRGVAPAARLFVQGIGVGLKIISDEDLQKNVALTNALISNNSWNYVGDSSYSLAAASYDAAVRDSLPGVTGSQPVLYVFSAGNDGDGNDAGLGGNPGSILSPGTAKNVLTVGAIELARDITNIVTKITNTSTNSFTNTSTPWKDATSSGNQVAAFSSRGNVGIGVEGDVGRIKPDLVAPGTFVISTRSSTWDEVAYYNPTNHHYSIFRNQVVGTNGLNDFSFFLPDNTVGFSIDLFGNLDSPVPFPRLPIYVKRDGTPTTQVFDLRRTNSVNVPPDLGGVGAAVGQNWYYSIGNQTREEVNFDILTDIITTNDLGDYYTVLSNLNNSISGTNGVGPHYYRYESGTSMAAGQASGTLALLQEFFQTMNVTNSPALMKALLINGARSAGNLYDFQTRNSINYQGWGLFKLNNSLPPAITNAFKFEVPGSIKLVDQSPTNALATGQSKTWKFKFDEDGQTLPFRVTLAWTDPPGNPAAGVKLVNDLDLVVTNEDTGDIYWGNDISSGTFSFPWDTNDPPHLDSVNNVENVFIDAPLGTNNYSVTVIARRVNVNAVTAHPNNVVQDFALVISSGNGESTNAITVSESSNPIKATEPVEVVYATNSLTELTFSSATLVNQRIGANTPLLGTTNGITNQWKFYVLTNSTDFTNASFLVSQLIDLATPRLGVFARGLDESTRRYADIDLYVSTNSALTNLDPVVVAGSSKSLSRNDLSGDEFVTFIDSTKGATYYVGVKSEDQQAAQFELWGIFSLEPLGQEDTNGYVRAYPISGAYEIPDGSPAKPGGTRFMARTRASLTGGTESVRRVIVTNNVTHENYGDVISTLDHNSRAVVLDNHRGLDNPPYPDPPGPYSFLYDDSGEGDFPTAIRPDGPGTFEDYMGEIPGGHWYFIYSDDALSQTGRVNDVRIKVERQLESDLSVTNDVAPNSWRYYSRNVPLEATNLNICISNISGTPQPLQLYVRKGRRPTPTVYDYATTIIPPGDCLSISKFSLPPLTAGRYFVGIFNPNPISQTFIYSATVELGPAPIATTFNGVGNQPILDDAGTNYSQTITNDAIIDRLDVGLRIDHPRVSDLAVTLISPRGTRVLLVENRGGSDTNGFGSSTSVTNFVPVAATGGPASNSVAIDTGSTVGKVTIEYDFFGVPDQMTVYYEGLQLTNTGMIPNSGRFTLNYGPGASTFIEVRMNEFGNPSTNTAWNYSVSSYNTANSYLVFTDNTNLTTMPIKFAAPPFRGTIGSTTTISDFDPPVLVQDYIAPSGVDGWNVLTNRVTVISNTAYSGSNSLALRSGQISRSLTTIAGRTYRLGYAYRKATGLDGIISWWRGENNAFDSVDGNHGMVQGSMTYSPGQVGTAFNFAAVNQKILVADAANLKFTNAMTVEAWINPRTLGGYPREILSKWEGGFNQRSYTFSIDTTGRGYFLVSRDGGFANVNQVFSSTTIPIGSWTHVAGVYDGASLRFYVNGILQNTVPWTQGIFPGSATLVIGSTFASGSAFDGLIDEPTVYKRGLSAGEIADIYAAGTAGKCGMVLPPNLPNICGSALGAIISVPGQTATSFLGTTNWQLGGLLFNATAASTPVNLVPVSSNAPAGVLVDHFTLTEADGPRYVLPEESLKVLEGENAYGEWQLEILDTRTGASNNVNLADWQLQFTFQDDSRQARVLVPGTPVTGTVCAQKIDYYIVEVPAWSRFATNRLLSATGPLNVYYNEAIRPTGTNTVPRDFNLLIGQTSGIVTLTTNDPAPVGLPVLKPGQRYYIGIENPGTNACVTYSFFVDFDLAVFPVVVDLTNGVPHCTVNSGPDGLIDYYRFTVASNSVRAQFELNNLSGDLTLLLRRGIPPTFAIFDYLSANVFTNDEVITVFDSTQPVRLAPGDWYFGAGNVSGGAVSYCAVAYQWPVYGTNIVITNSFLGTNSFCLTWTSLPGMNYYVEGITNLASTNWVVATPTIKAVDYSTTACVPLPSPLQFFRVREGTAQNPFFPPPIISVIRKTFDGILLTWGGPLNAQYQVQWSPSITPAVWTTFPNPPAVTSTTGLFQFLDDGTQTTPPGFITTRYYRLILLP